MKRLLCLILILLLPACSLAESIAALESSQPLLLPGTPEGILDCISLPDGGALINASTFANLEGTGAGGWRLLYLLRIDAAGSPVWETRYHAGPGADIIELALTQDIVNVYMYNDVIGNENCKQITLVFDLATGRQVEEPEQLGIPVGEIASVTHCGDFRIDEYIHNGGADTVRTVIHHLPNSRRAEYEFRGLQHCTAFDSKLICCFVDAQDMAYYSVYDADCLPIAESSLIAPGAYVNHSAAGENNLYLFAWTNRADPDHRSYTVYPVDDTLNTGAPIASFTLEEGHALGQVALCGDGFLLTDEFPWEYGQPTRYDLLFFSCEGVLTPISTFLLQHEDSVILLPGTDEGHARVVCREEKEMEYLQQVYVAQ